MDILAQEEIIRRIATIERKIDEINRPEVVLVGDIAAGVYGLEDDAGVEAEPAVDGNIQLYSSDDTVSIVSGVDDINFTIDVAPGDAQYLTLALDADLDNERVFVAGAGCTGVDGGAGGNYTLNVDDPHVEIHVVNSTGPHAEGGLTIGHVLRASAAAAFSFAELQHDDLGGVGTGDHHSQVHNVTNMGDHTVVGAQWDVLGCDGLNVLGMLTPSDDPGAAIAILRTDAAGLLNLVALDVDTISDESGGDLTLQPAGDIVLDPTGNDVTLVEANLTIPTTYHLYLRDVALTIYSSADGQLDIDADTELELTSPTIQLVAVTKVDVDGDLEVDGDLDFVGAQEITTTAGDLTIAPAGDVIFDPAGDDILPTTNYDLNIGALSKKYLTIHAAELWVETLVAQDTIATIGGRVLVGPTTMLAVDLAAGTVNGANDILNPGFEIAGAGDPDFFANWIENGGDGIIAQDAVIFHSGAKSAKLTNGETSSTYVSQEIVVVPADDKELVFWARGDGTDEGRYRVYDVTNGADIQAITATGVGLATWTRVAYRYEVPALCIAVRIDLYCPERIATPVLNPGFEDAGLGGVDVFDEWTESAGDGAIAQDGVIFSGGAESAKLTSGPTFNTFVHQTIAVIPGDNRELIFMARGDGANQGRYLIYDQSNGADIVAISPTGVAAAAWNKVQNPYTVPAGCTFVRLYFYGPAVNGADTWFDDVDDYRAGDAWFDDIDHYDQVEISVEHNEMVEGDISYMEANAKVEFFDITSDHAGVGPYTYYVRRDQDGSGANDWYAGDAMFNTGAAGDGFIDLYSIQSIGAGGAGPTIVGNVRNSDTYNDWTEYWAIGNLDGMYGYGVDIYGVGLGEYGGEYVTIEATNGIRMYSDGNQRVAIDTDGSFWFGDTAATERLTWDTVEGLRIFNADNEAVITVDTAGDAYIDNRLMINMGDAGIFADNGLLLLGPGCELTSTSWTSLRGQEATIANAFQTRAGAFPGTRGIVMEPGTTNYCFNGAMRDDDADDEADLWTLIDNCTDPVSIDVQAHPNPIMGWLQRFYYTGVAGDVNADTYFYYRTEAATFAEGEDACVSCDIKGAIGGSVTVTLRCRALDVANGSLGVQNQEVTVSAGLQRVYVVYEDLPADTSKIQATLRCSAIDVGDWFNVFFGAVNVEKRTSPTTFCSGQLPWCTWDADEYDSESDRTGTTMTVATIGNISASKGSIAIRFKLLTLYNPLGGRLFSAGNVNGEFDGIVSSAGAVQFYINGVNRCTHSPSSLDQDHCIVFEWDAAEDDSWLYFDGVLADTGTCGGGAWTPGTNMGIGYSPSLGVTYNPCCIVTEFAVFDDLLTADEIAADWSLRRPIVDHGAMDSPGIYIMDGRFRISSAYTGTRIEITADEIAGYNEAVKQFYLSAVDGKAYAGAGAVTLGVDGLSIELAAAEANSRAYQFLDSGGSVISSVRGSNPAGAHAIAVDAISQAGKDTFAYLTADAPDGKTSHAKMHLYHGGLERGYVDLYSSTVAANDIAYLDVKANEFYFRKAAGQVKMFIGETANTDMSAGLTVNQQAADDEILAIKSSDVTHGATDFAETDTYGHMKKSEADAGGLLIRGLRDNGAGAFAGLNLQGLLAKNTDTGKTNTAQGIVAIYGLQTSGASVANTVADGNICSFHTYRGGAYVTVVIIDEDGDIYYEGGMVEYDEQDDIALLRELNEVFSQTPAENTIHARARKARPELERVVEKLGFVHINEDGSAFVSTRRERALLRGAAVQSHDMLMEKIAILEARLVELEASRE